MHVNIHYKSSPILAHLWREKSNSSEWTLPLVSMFSP